MVELKLNHLALIFKKRKIMNRNRLKHPILIIGIAVVLIVAMLGGCGAPNGTQNL